ncbi:MAG: SMP-30/gluconolactonase/LRE family protein [Chitinophagaceae bacterium]
MKHVTERIIHLPFYTEGPCMDSNGTIYCTTLSGGNILQFNNTNVPHIWAKSVCPNGQYISRVDEHFVCDSKSATINRYNSKGNFLKTEMNGKCNGSKVYCPNDLLVDSTGGIYFTDSIRQDGKVGYISADGIEKIVLSGLEYPNGLVLSQDEKFLYVAESYRNRILIAALKSPGASEGYDVFTDLPSHNSGNEIDNLPDGLALDANGRLWVAHYGMQALQIISRQGVVIDSIAIPFPLVSNVFIENSILPKVLVTGGYAEPGPGALVVLSCLE